MPNSKALVEKYLPLIFEKQINSIKKILNNKRFSIIIDESPDYKNRPLLNILACFYDENKKERKVIMLESKVITECNAVFVANEVSQTLQQYNLHWKKCISLISDCASYIKKYYKDMCVAYQHIIIIPCFFIIIHYSIRKTIDEFFFI